MSKTSTSQGLQPQPWDWPHPRVLLEVPPRQDADARIDALRRAGYAVAVCPGPAAPGRCPLTGDDGCAAAHGADIVVSSLGLKEEQARDALATLRLRLPHLPVLVETDAELASRWPDLVLDGTRVEPGIAAPELVERVKRTLSEEAIAGA